MTRNELKKLCKQYDEKHGEYPEHIFEGEAVLKYLLKNGFKTNKGE
jgi:hypothetical protein